MKRSRADAAEPKPFPHDTWELALQQARARDVGLLVRFLRRTPGVDASAAEVPAAVREFLADVLVGRVKIPGRSGNRGKLDSWDRWIIRAVLVNRGSKDRSAMIRELASAKGVTESTIRDVLSKRRGYADK